MIINYHLEMYSEKKKKYCYYILRYHKISEREKDRESTMPTRRLVAVRRILVGESRFRHIVTGTVSHEDRYEFAVQDRNACL